MSDETILALVLGLATDVDLPPKVRVAGIKEIARWGTTRPDLRRPQRGHRLTAPDGTYCLRFWRVERTLAFPNYMAFINYDLNRDGTIYWRTWRRV